MTEAAAIVPGITSPWLKVRAYATLVTRARPSEREAIFIAALEATRQIENDWLRGRAIGILGGNLPASLIEPAFTIVQTLEAESVRVLALSNLAQHLPPEINAGLLQAAPIVVDEWLRASLINRLIEHVPDASEAVSLAQTISEPAARAAALSGIAQHVLAEPQSELLNEALAAARSRMITLALRR